MILLLDEPDVHLHPDLQYKFIQFLLENIKGEVNVKVFIATHSTAILSSFLDNKENATVAFLCKDKSNNKEIEFHSISKQLTEILPIFGAHPLTSVYNEMPILFVEGDNDLMIWQQAVKSSRGKIKLFPVSCDGIDKVNKYEDLASKILTSVYGNKARAYSLRDGDCLAKQDNDKTHPQVTRLHLFCREAENLLLTNEVLEKCKVKWEDIEKKIEEWLGNNSIHSKHSAMLKFKESKYNRKDHKIKDIINILVSFINSNKPWTFLIGQTIGELTTLTINKKKCGSIYLFLGQDLINILGYN